MFLLGIALVFFVLAALYESWLQPLAVILALILGVVPLMVAEGAGKELHWSLRVAVFSRMIDPTGCESAVDHPLPWLVPSNVMVCPEMNGNASFSHVRRTKLPTCSFVSSAGGICHGRSRPG